MRKNLLVAFLITASIGKTLGQCDPQAHDWGTDTFGVSPNPNLGENFLPAFVNTPYSDVVYVLTPVNASDVDSTLSELLLIDSLSLDSITVINGMTSMSITNLGLNVICNNNGDSPNPCMFMPGESYCGDIVGTPTTEGTYDVLIWATAYFMLFGPQEYPLSFDGYVLNVSGPLATLESESPAFDVKQNIPNPTSGQTTIGYTLNSNAPVQFNLVNLVGETIQTTMLNGKRGENLYQLNTSDLETGIYLYTIQSGDRKVTRKMVVSH